MDSEPRVTDVETIEKTEAYQSLEPVKRPTYWGVDLDMARRPGVPSHRVPQMMPNARWPITRQQGESSAFMHGRPNKTFPPVFSTAMPAKGLSCLVRKAAASMPDHKPAHWLLKLLGDRVELWTYRAKKYGPIALPAMAAFFVVRLARGES